MHEKVTIAKTTLSAISSALAAFLGWKGVLVAVWVICMGLDYLSGSAAACSTGEWSSSVARQGIWHKMGMVLAVIVAGIADLVVATVCGNIDIGITYPAVILPLILSWYILTELGSILENAVKLGARVPDWLIKFLKLGTDAIENAGSNQIPADK